MYTVYSSRLPKRRFKLKFHTDAKQKPHAKIDPKWESQLTYVEPDENHECIKREMNDNIIMISITKIYMLYQTIYLPTTHYTTHNTIQILYHNSMVILMQMNPNIPPYLSIWKKFGAPLNSQWNEIFKVLHNESNPYLMPIQAPNKLGQLLYKFNIEGYDVTTLLDLGASHSFITRTWASSKGLDLTPIRPPRPVGLFSGQKIIYVMLLWLHD